MGRRARVALVLAVLASCSNNGPAIEPVRIPLENMPAGVVTLRFDTATQRMEVHLDGYGFVPMATYTLHIHAGTCLSPTGRALVTFEPVKADAAGDAKVDVRSLSLTPAGIPSGASVDLHRSSSPTVMSGCTDIPTRASTAPLRLFAPPTRKPLGSVIATYKDGRTLELRFDVTGLDASSTHAVDLKSGSCADRGLLVGGQLTLTADPAGAASSTTIVHVARDPKGFHADIYATDSDDTLALCADVPAYKPPVKP